MYCRNCGTEIEEEDLFCSKCGSKIKLSVKEDNASHKNDTNLTTESENVAKKEDPDSWVFIKICAYLISIVVLVSVFWGLCQMGMYIISDSDSQKISDLQASDSTTTSSSYSYKENSNLEKCEEIAQNYYETHTYVDGDIFDCDNMAMDVWNLIESQGINAQIAVGNVDMSDESLEDMNHAWVLAEVAPQSWVAIECTGGYVTYDEEYYSGWFFDNPKNYQSFLDLYNDWQYQYQDYENYRDYYNELVEIYNNANYYEQLGMESGMTVAKNTLEEKERVFLRTDSELDALLEYG